MRAIRLGVVIAVCFLSGCSAAFFYPDRVLVHRPESYGLKYDPVQFSASDGTELYGWFLYARGPARGTVLYLHGNAQNISAHLPNVAWLPDAGFNVFAIDYRGYGRSDGSASFAGMQLDIDAAMQTLLARSDIDAQRIVIFGQSLGASAAIYYAAHSSYRQYVRALVADSAFADYRQVASEKMAGLLVTWPLQWLPRFTVDNHYSPLEAVAAISPIPLLIIYGDRDEVVPAQHSELLFKQAEPPKAIWGIHGAGHIGALRRPEVRERLASFLREQVSQTSTEIATARRPQGR